MPYLHDGATMRPSGIFMLHGLSRRSKRRLPAMQNLVQSPRREISISSHHGEGCHRPEGNDSIVTVRWWKSEGVSRWEGVRPFEDGSWERMAACQSGTSEASFSRYRLNMLSARYVSQRSWCAAGIRKEPLMKWRPYFLTKNWK
jgi:hypothetical protein